MTINTPDITSLNEAVIGAKKQKDFFEREAENQKMIAAQVRVEINSLEAYLNDVKARIAPLEEKIKGLEEDKTRLEKQTKVTAEILTEAQTELASLVTKAKAQKEENNAVLVEIKAREAEVEKKEKAVAKAHADVKESALELKEKHAKILEFAKTI